MAHGSRTDIRKALDTAARGAGSNPVTRKLRATLQGDGQKYNGNQDDASEVITVLTGFGNCIYDVDPRLAKAFKGVIESARSKRQPEGPGIQRDG
jgi:hypothetical protein